MTKIQRIGIIAEDESDYESLKIIVNRILNKNSLTFKKKLGKGCTKIKKKCLPWSDELGLKGCQLLIILHDADDKNPDELLRQLSSQLKDSTVKNRYVCIPVEELEAWFLSDPAGLKLIMNLDRAPNVKGNPETVNSPKEFLEDEVDRCSNGRVVYVHTIHNAKIAKNISIDAMIEKSESFNKFNTFILSQAFK